MESPTSLHIKVIRHFAQHGPLTIDAFWKSGCLTVEKPSFAKVFVLIQEMTSAGFLKRDLSGRYTKYTVAVSESELQDLALDDTLNSVFAGNMRAMDSALDRLRARNQVSTPVRSENTGDHGAMVRQSERISAA